MLAEADYYDLDSLVDAAVPSRIRTAAALALPEPATEAETAAELAALANRNILSVRTAFPTPNHLSLVTKQRPL